MSILILAVGLFFMAALLGLIALYMTYASVKGSPTYELKRRLRKMAIETGEGLPADLRLEIIVEMTPLDKVLYKLPFVRKLLRHGHTGAAHQETGGKRTSRVASDRAREPAHRIQLEGGHVVGENQCSARACPAPFRL